MYFEKEYPHHDEAKRGYETSVLERLDEQGQNGGEQYSFTEDPTKTT